MTKFVIDKKIQPSWNIIQEILDQVKVSIPIDDNSLIETVTSVVNELIENALKYGKFIPGIPESSISLHIEMDQGILKIIISNYIASEENLKTFTDHIDRINESENPKDLYVERLKELLDGNTYEQSQLGLYKIGFESKFDLDYKIGNDILTIIATKNLNK